MSSTSAWALRILGTGAKATRAKSGDLISTPESKIYMRMVGRLAISPNGRWLALLLTDANVDFATGDPYLAAVTTRAEYFLNAYDEALILTEIDRNSGEIVNTTEFEGWWASIAVNDNDEVLGGASGLLILPSGEKVPMDGTSPTSPGRSSIWNIHPG